MWINKSPPKGTPFGGLLYFNLTETTYRDPGFVRTVQPVVAICRGELGSRPLKKYASRRGGYYPPGLYATCGRMISAPTSAQATFPVVSWVRPPLTTGITGQANNVFAAVRQFSGRYNHSADFIKPTKAGGSSQ